MIATFIAEADSDTLVRFRDYEARETFKDLRECRRHGSALGWEPFPSDEAHQINDESWAMRERYGARLSSSYDWAHPALLASNPALERRSVYFSDLEEAVELTHRRPLYRMASDSVHAGWRSALAFSDDEQPSGELLLHPDGNGINLVAAPALQCLLVVTGKICRVETR